MFSHIGVTVAFPVYVSACVCVCPCMRVCACPVLDPVNYLCMAVVVVGRVTYQGDIAVSEVRIARDCFSSSAEPQGAGWREGGGFVLSVHVSPLARSPRGSLRPSFRPL